MNLFFYIFLFVIIFIFYLHLTKQFKKGEDLVIYEMDYIDNAHLQEICQDKKVVSF